MILTILTARVWPQKHPGPILPSMTGAFKRAGLHYITFFADRYCRRGTCCRLDPQKSQNRGSRDELGLTPMGHARLSCEPIILLGPRPAGAARNGRCGPLRRLP